MEIRSPFRLPRKTPFGVGEQLAEWATGLNQLDKFYAQRPARCDTQQFLRYTLDVLGIDYQIIHGQLNDIPIQGATVVVANHPLGGVEGVILAELLLMIRSDVQILANQYLKTVPELDELFIGVDVFEGKGAHAANLKAMRSASRHLENGGLLLMFPAGEVSQLVGRNEQQLADKEWSRSVSRLIRQHRATSVPVYIQGQNSKRFYLAGKIHPLLRTLMLGRELLNKQQKPIKLAIGETIKYKEVKELTDHQMVNYLRLNTYLLNNSADNHSLPNSSLDNAEPIADPRPLAVIQQELASLPSNHHLLTHQQFEVYCSDAAHIPNLLHEIGRLREINFRQVGEGTGNACDLDSFDQHYLHLFVWDSEQQCLVGAYRLGLVDEILYQQGIEGFYSRTLFHYQQPFLDQLEHSIELGRSVIAAQYQKSMSALLLLWKGIATFISRHPHYTHLFGPVSISNEYSQQTRQLIAETMTLHHYDAQKASLVSASNPLPTQSRHWTSNMLSALSDLQLLSRVIARVEPGRSVPVLLRQYLSLNGKIVSFNLDPAFNNALDGLILVDLRNVPVKTLARYMGSQAAQCYLTYHQERNGA
ncbi:lysophospholipid acyltransferase family protein [Vibrio sp.]|uniref:lysophospholipid acyltransferase family protein n=1 Tax=Vibrio sp. TaxID=678 RepID=UPI003D14FDE8